MNSEELKKKYAEFAKNSLVQIQYSCSGNSSSFCEFDSEEDAAPAVQATDETNSENTVEQ